MGVKILVVDDEPDIRAVLGECLTAAGFETQEAGDGAEAVAAVQAERPAVILLDVIMPRQGGIEALPELKRIAPDVPVIMCTAYMDVPTAVRAMQLGAYDYLTKPFDPELLLLTVKRALERRELLARIDELKSQGEGISLAERMGGSRGIESVIQQVAQVARSNFTVLIQGETGTGKELVARAIHNQSPRRDKPFVAVDCGAIPETLVESELFGYEKGAFTGAVHRKDGRFQAAGSGTVFLDEVGNLPLPTQAKLLRALEERQVTPLGATRPVPVDARIIAASNVDLEDASRAGRFRPDLYYRLNEFGISLPPLRSRREDIAHLASRFLDEVSMELRRPVHGITDDAMELLRLHDWPGNVRELKNVIRKAALLATDLITPEFLPPLGAPGGGRQPDVEAPTVSGELSLREVTEVATADAERQAIRQALEAAKGNKSQAARLLRTDYSTLHAKMKRYGISARDFQDA
ncbi:MAG: sigma-54 dependent transcriptional regulator [Candidatus Rokubacteria bacterium]|nr:sigma-54 dependent transcriptional regulator [Candidatus Rokubacteria bacterium]